MSYQSSNVAYNRWQPDRLPGREDYYYRGNNDSGNHVMNRDRAPTRQWQNQANQQDGDFHNTRQQDTEPNQYRYSEQRRSGDNPVRQDYDYSSNREQSHRYPQTFESDQNQLPRQTSPERRHGSQNENFNSNTNVNPPYYSERDSYTRDNWPDNQRDRYSQQHQPTQQHGLQYRSSNSNASYNTDPQQDTRQNFPPPTTYQESSPERYRSSERNDGYGYAGNRDENRHIPPDHAKFGQGSPQRENFHSDQQNEYSNRNRDFQQYDSRPVYQPERPHNNQDNQQNQYSEDYRNRPYNSDKQHSSDPQRVVANMSGSSAYFGVVAKNDFPPNHYEDPRQASPNRVHHQPALSPAEEYPPSFDRYRGNDSNRPQNQQRQPPHSNHHQYRNALTPISEKDSPSSSIGSKGHSQDTITNMPPPPSSQNQYGNRQSWDNHGRNNFQNQRQLEHERQPYGQSQRPQAQQERSQTHFSRPGYKDYDTSSGYASESTHNTEKIPNEMHQHPNKSHYSPQFPPPPPEAQGQDWTGPSNDRYSQSPSRNQESQRHHYDRNPPPLLQGSYEHGYQDDDARHYGQDAYGPPVSAQSQYNNKVQRNDKYDSQGFHQEHAPYPKDYSKRVGNEPQRPYNPSQKTDINQRSGVEEAHVPSVQAARSLFEKKSDPRRPPPAPKPIIVPKPTNVNTRPIPPRPSAVSASTRWEGRDDRNHFQSGPYLGPKSPTSPQNFGRQPYIPNPQPSHRQSMDNLDDRSRYLSPPPPKGPPHAHSLQNLDERSAPAREANFSEPRGRLPSTNQPQPSQENYPRDDFQRPNVSDERPLVVAVKFNQESGVSLHAAKEPPKRHGSWNNSQPNIEPPPQEPTYREQRQSWSDNTNSNHQRSFRGNQNWPSNYPSQRPEPVEDDRNYVPDVVARSYEMAQTQAPQTENFQTKGSNPYEDRKAPRRQDLGYDDRGQRGQNYRNMSDQQSSNRWPTPPPPISQDQSRPPPRPDNFGRVQPISEDWPRTRPQQHSHSQPNQSYDNHHRPPNESNSQNNPTNADEISQQQSHPPQPQYKYDSDSSEIDVDAPTPPPTQNRKPATSFDMPRGHSSYDRNKPIPVPLTDQGDSWRIVGEQPPNGNRPAKQSQPYSQQYPTGKEQPMSKNPPLKPHRNSTSLSPRLAQASLSENRDFDFDVNVTQPLRNQSSREKARLGKSGALANRKPPSRNGSASNLTEITDEDNFQIEVTDSDLSSTNNKMEVHRMESMRILQTEKGKRDKDLATAAPAASSDKRPRSSQKAASNPSSEAKSESRKVDSKLFFKKPAGDAAKTIPMPEITEPANQPTRRPPTYLGFGHTPDKPKADLLSQFKNARDSAMRTAADKQNKAMKSVTALVKFNQGKKEVKKLPQPKLTAAEKNAQVLSKMNIEVSVPPQDHEDDRSRNPYHRHRDGHANNDRNSTRSSSTVKPEKYDGDDDTTNGSKHERERHGRGRDRHRADDKPKSRGRSTSRERNLSPDRRRGRSSSRGRETSPDRRRGRSTSRGRNLSPERQNARSRHRSKSRERSLSPDDRHRPRPSYGDRRYDDRYRRNDDSSYRRSNSPDRPRYDDRRYERMPEHRHYHPERGAREPDWVEQFRRGRDVGRSSGHQVRRAWVNDPRRVEVTVNGRRRELDMDAFEREVKNATSYNSDFEQPSRRQMIPSKLSAKGPPPNSKRKPPPNNWMNDLKERNRMAAKARYGVYNPPPYQRRAEGDLKYYYKFGRVPRY